MMLLIIYRVSLLPGHLFLDLHLGDRGFWFCSELAPFTDDVFFITGKDIKSISIL